MCTGRKKYRPFNIFKWDLIQFWSDKFNNSHDGIWNVDDGINGQGEGACLARIITYGGRIYKGKFDSTISRHAEMNALFSHNQQFRGQNIKAIEISSPPCPSCAVVLEVLGLSDKVYTRQVPIRRALSFNMSIADFESIFDYIIPDGVKEEAKIFPYDVYVFFASGEWYDIAKTNGIIK